jgi:hypothetical protein
VLTRGGASSGEDRPFLQSWHSIEQSANVAWDYSQRRLRVKVDWHFRNRSASRNALEEGTRPGRQFCAPPKPFIASVIPAGLSMICEKRTTVTVSSGETVRP